MRAGLIGQEDDAGGSNVEVLIVEVGVVERREEVEQVEARRKFQIAFAEVGLAVEGAVAGDGVDIAGGVGGGGGSALPDRGAIAIRRRVEDSRLLQRPRIIAEQPAVIVPQVAMRGESDVDGSIGEQQADALFIISRNKRDRGSAVARAGD